MATALRGGSRRRATARGGERAAASPARARRAPAGDAGARQAGTLLACVGLLGLLTDLVSGSMQSGHLLMAVLDVANVGAGLVVWALPWSRLPRQSRLVLPVLGLASVAANSAAGTVPVASVGVWYVLIFVWVGLWYPPRTVVAFGPLAAAAYLVPFAFSAPRTDGAAVAVVLVVPVGVLVGVSIARRTSSDLARLRAEDRLARAMEGAPISLFACDADGTITFNQVSPSLAGTPAFLAGGFGGLPDVNVGLKLDEVFKDNPARLGRIRRVLAGEEFTAEVEAAGDFLEVRYRPVRDKAGSVVGATCVGFNVTERVKAQRERLRLEARVLADTRRQAYTDELTGLANRRRLYERLDTLMTGRPGPTGFALLLLDLDRFKEVNDALGHAAGDRLLLQVGARLSEALGEAALVARLGGDEFALVLGPGSDRLAVEAAECVVASFGRPFDLTDVSMHANASIGIALYPGHASSRSELMRCADVAMYRAKRARLGFAVYDRGSDSNDRGRLVAIEQLRDAIGNGQLVCHFQPKLAIGSGQVVGAEALVRWAHPSRGLLGPAEFVALAEQAGLVGRLSRSVLAYALGECRMWHEAGHEISVAVNLAVSDLLDASLPDRVAGLLTAHGLRPESLVLEITEDAIMVDPDRVGTIVAELRSFGVGFSVDDYGTGYSSLSYLRDLPIQELKIDRSFVTGISGSAKDQAIVAATVSLARSLGVRLVAEGVETLADWDYLRRLGVEVAQGYAISRPKCAPHFSAWLAGCSQLVGRGGLPGISDVFQPADQQSCAGGQCNFPATSRRSAS